MYDCIVSRFSLTEQRFHGIPQLVDCIVLGTELFFRTLFFKHGRMAWHGLMQIKG
jgi:hypothetical protein